MFNLSNTATFLVRPINKYSFLKVVKRGVPLRVLLLVQSGLQKKIYSKLCNIATPICTITAEVCAGIIMVFTYWFIAGLLNIAQAKYWLYLKANQLQHELVLNPAGGDCYFYCIRQSL